MRAHVPPDGELDPPGDPESVARVICLRQLAQRARTRAELAAVLQRRGVPDDAARSVLDRFTDIGLIDDGALAASFAMAVHRERGLAGRAVAMKLRRRGIDEATLQAAVGQIDAESEADAARLLVARRRKSLQGLEPQAQARRLVGLLARRGYPPGLAYQIVRESLACPEIADAADIED
ncbi:MAG TPA: regulatory protein RecX [Jatrophihabitantaceae bacterium]